MEKVFSYNADIEKTAYMNWRTRQHQPIHDMIIIADGYMKSAIMLAEDCLLLKRQGCCIVYSLRPLFLRNSWCTIIDFLFLSFGTV